jgi:RND family efflux transporter MFP subunit
MNRKKTLLISTFILLAGGIITVLIFMTEPKAVRGGATKETAMLVEVMEVNRGDFRPTISAMGTVEPSQDIVLAPRVRGEVIKLAKAFIPGGFVNKGDTLLLIDPADYKNTLEQRRSHLRQMIADLNIEMGRQFVAKKDYQLLDETLPKNQEALILRKPQLNAARSRVEAAKAAVRQAELDLQRTTVKAPFNAHILSRSVNVGSQVSPGENLGRLVGIDTYWIVTTVPPAKIRWLTFPRQENERGSDVRIRNRSAWREGEYRSGYLYKLVGTLEEQTRMARVLVLVPDPLAHRKESAGLPPMMIGSFVETNIQAEEMTGVMRIHRDYVRKNNTVWVMENRRLRIRNVEIIFRDKTYAYITKGLSNRDIVVTTNLTTVVDGAALRLKSDIPPTGNSRSDTDTKTPAAGGSGK